MPIKKWDCGKTGLKESHLEISCMASEGRIVACIGCAVAVALGSNVRAQQVEQNLLSQSELSQEIEVDIESLEGGSEPVVSDESDGTS